VGVSYERGTPVVSRAREDGKKKSDAGMVADGECLDAIHPTFFDEQLGSAVGAIAY
jgi:hypothetical protein